MTKMSSVRAPQKKVVERNTMGTVTGNGTTGHEFLWVPPGAPMIDLEKLEYSFAAPYVGPPIDYPLPKAQLAHIYVDGKASETKSSSRQRQPGSVLDRDEWKRSLPVAQPLGVLSPVTGVMNKGPVSVPVSGTPPVAPRTSMPVTHRGSSSSPVPSSSASPLSEPSPLVSEYKQEFSEAAEVKLKQSMKQPASSPDSSSYLMHQRASPSEIEELTPSPSALSPPSGQFFHRTPSFEGNATDSSVLQYSEDFSLPESGEITPHTGASPAMNGNSGPYMLDSAPSGRHNQHRKKGQCYRCLKGRRLTEKEICLVCGAKYCMNCVLIVMGSMPEGRKCEGCVGRPILESRRPYLGKPSRVLRRLLNPLEIQQCMKSEKECLSNQLQPEQVFVNGRSLVAEEMAQLLGCLKLKPGRYWYDKVSGLWGKEGEKPDAVITPDLKVGGGLQPKASNGTTQVYLNDREITKSELKMMKMLGVQCPPHTYLVLYPDGRYGEQGQKEFKGNLWTKTTNRLLHPFFSFPTPRTNSNLSKADSNGGSSRLSSAYLEIKHVHKILLLGHDGSGRSTIFKQAKILQNGQFSLQEVQKYKEMILEKAYHFLFILLEARERFEEEEDSQSPEADLDMPASNHAGARTRTRRSIYSLNQPLKDAADKFLDDMANNSLERITSVNTEFNLSKLWNDLAIQATYKRKDELHMLPDVAGDLLNRVFQTSEYLPSEPDILLAEGLEQGTGLAEIEFTLEDKESMSDSNDHESYVSRYQLISIGGLATNEFRKWLDMFEDIQVLVYCVAISDYDQLWTDSSGTTHNKLIFSRDLFVKIVSYPCFQDTPLVLLLNKYDKFEEKVTRGIPLTTCEWFSDYSPVGSASNSSQVQQSAYMYVVHKYKRMLNGRRVYTLQLNAQDPRAVSGSLEYVQQILKCEEEKRAGLWMMHEESMYGDTSSFTVQGHLENRQLCESRREHHGAQL